MAEPPWQSTLLRDHPLAGKIWNAASARFMTRDALVENLRRAHFRLLGEVHDNPDHHAIQAGLLEALGASGIKPLVAFEQFNSDFDTLLQQRLTSGPVTAEDVATAVHFNRQGWNWDFYRPLVDIALRYGMPLRAANLSRPAAAQVAKEGWAGFGQERIAALQLQTVWSAAREQALRTIIFEGHCGALPDSVVPRLANAQRVRDATLAWAMRTDNRDGSLLIAGNGHVRRDLGVPLYVSAGSKPLCAVGIVEVSAGENNPSSYSVSAEENDPRKHNASAEAGRPRYDFVCFTPRWDRPDPCANFQRR